jgi:hypothetical protein
LEIKLQGGGIAKGRENHNAKRAKMRRVRLEKMRQFGKDVEE